MPQELRDSWDVWRAKIDGDFDTYDPTVIEAIIERLNILHTYLAGVLKDLIVIKNTIAAITEQQQINTNDISNLKSAMTTAQGDISTLKSSVLTIEGAVSVNANAINHLQTELGTVEDVLNGIYPLLALGDITMYENVKSIFDNLPEP